MNGISVLIRRDTRGLSLSDSLLPFLFLLSFSSIPCEDTTRKWISKNQEVGSHPMPYLLAFGITGLQNWEIRLVYQFMVISYSSLNRLKHWVSQEWTFISCYVRLLLGCGCAELSGLNCTYKPHLHVSSQSESQGKGIGTIWYMLHTMKSKSKKNQTMQVHIKILFR